MAEQSEPSAVVTAPLRSARASTNGMGTSTWSAKASRSRSYTALPLQVAAVALSAFSASSTRAASCESRGGVAEESTRLPPVQGIRRFLDLEGHFD